MNFVDHGTQAGVVIFRERVTYRDRLSRYRVVINGMPVGALKQGQTGHFAVEPGKVRVQMRLGLFLASEPVDAKLAPGDVLALAVAPGPVHRAFVSPRSYLALHRKGELASQWRGRL